MIETTVQMTRIGLILKPDHAGATALQNELVQALTARGHEVVGTSASFPKASGRILPSQLYTCDLICSLGGDGTILGASADLGTSDTPILGINLGRLGFLAAFDRLEVLTAIERAINDELPIAKRVRLEVSVGGMTSQLALNDVVVHQANVARLLELEVWLDGQFVSSYRADGLIVCTPTGSTAYNLAAGGPIMFPGQSVMGVTPICPHALTNRPLVVPQGVELTVVAPRRSNSAIVTVDGQTATPVEPGTLVSIKVSESPLHLFESEKPYFDILREKLHWGAHAARRNTEC